MSHRHQQRELIRFRLLREVGTLHGRKGLRVGLVYPSPYRVGMSSLGFQTIYRIINTETSHSAERVFLPDVPWSGPLLTYETLSYLGDMDVIAFSLAYELEIPGVIECLRGAGLEPLAKDRLSGSPPVIIGGPITYSNPLSIGPYADIMILGEAEPILENVLDRIGTYSNRPQLLESLADMEGVYIPSLHLEQVVPLAKADDRCLPAYSQIITAESEFSSMHLVEAERGCNRQCAFCIMRQSTNHGMRLVEPKQIIRTIPEHSLRVGLVGAAVSDHPHLLQILSDIIESGREIGLSSLRADRVTPELLSLLHQGGYRTLTVAADGASERLRRYLLKGVTTADLLNAAELARTHDIATLKLYVMVGVPRETEEDIEELIGLLTQLGRILPVTVSISPFVAKKNTPLDGSHYGGIKRIGRRLKHIRTSVGDLVEIKSTSARWGWVQYALSQGGPEMAEAALVAYDRGGHFKDWKEAIATFAPQFVKYVGR